MQYPNQIFSAFAFLGFVLALVPFRQQYAASNVGTCLYSLWAALGCFVFAVNSIVWNDNVIVKAKFWCDISIHVVVAQNVAIPAAALCIQRRLYHVSVVRRTRETPREFRRQVIIDLLIGAGIPLLQAAFFIIPQGHRGDLYEGTGPLPEFDNTWVAYVLFSSWPVIIGVVSAVYAVLNLINFAKHRAIFREFLADKQNLDSASYVRQMALSVIELAFTTPFTVWILYIDATVVPIKPWISWANVHSNFDRFDQYPSIIWRSNSTVETVRELQRWSPILCAFVFFSFFGSTQEMRRLYRSALLGMAIKLGARPMLVKMGVNFPEAPKVDLLSDSVGTLPLYSTKDGTVDNTILPAKPQLAIIVDREQFMWPKYDTVIDISATPDISVPSPHDDEAYARMNAPPLAHTRVQSGAPPDYATVDPRSRMALGGKC